MSEMTLDRKLDSISKKAISIYKRITHHFIGKKFHAKTIAIKKIIFRIKPLQGQDNQDEAVENMILARLKKHMPMEDNKNY